MKEEIFEKCFTLRNSHFHLFKAKVSRIDLEHKMY